MIPRNLQPKAHLRWAATAGPTMCYSAGQVTPPRRAAGSPAGLPTARAFSNEPGVTMDQGSALEKANAPAGSGLDRPYQPQEIETRWYEHWIARGEFTPPPHAQPGDKP